MSIIQLSYKKNPKLSRLISNIYKDEDLTKLCCNERRVIDAIQRNIQWTTTAVLTLQKILKISDTIKGVIYRLVDQIISSSTVQRSQTQKQQGGVE